MMNNRDTKVYLLENHNAGLTKKDGEMDTFIAKLFKQGIRIERLSSSQFASPQDFHSLCYKNNVDTVITNGGDGTVNFMLPFLIDSNISLLPLHGGTFNHFAKHIGIPKDLDEALNLLVTGNKKRIDLGEVNERLFINFATIGFYADIIKRRTKLQNNHILKWIAFIISLYISFKSYHYERVSFSLSSDATVTTPLLFVGNNVFNFGSADILKSRESFTDNVLHVGIFKDISKWQLLVFLWRALHVDLKKYFEFQDLREKKLVVKTKGHKVTVTLDGEVASLKSPLIFSSRSKAISVIMPG